MRAGFHNVAGHVDTTAYLNEEYVDAHLTAFGWRQVTLNLSAITSPTTRAWLLNR